MTDSVTGSAALYPRVRTPRKPVRSRLPRAKCRECGRVVAVNIPSGGYGTVDVFRNHKTPDGLRCSGGRREVRTGDYADA